MSWYSGSNNTTIPNPYKIKITGKTDVWVCGILIRDMDFSRVQDLEFGRLLQWTGLFLFLQLEKYVIPAIDGMIDVTTLNAPASKKDANSLTRSLQRRSLKEKTQSPALSDGIQIGSAVVDNMNLRVDSSGISLEADATVLGGPYQPYDFWIPLIAFNIHLDKSKFAQFQIKEFALHQNNYDLRVYTGLYPTVDSADFSKISDSLANIASSRPAIAGIKGIDFVLANNQTFPWIKTVFGELEVLYASNCRLIYPCRLFKNDLCR